MTASLTFETLRALDRGLGERALIFGSPPPYGRDVDLLVREEVADSITSALRDAGLAQSGKLWLTFRECTVVAVELIPAGRLGLPQVELDALFAEASPLSGLHRIVEPAPHHSLLILAQRVARSDGLAAKHRLRIDDVLSRDRHAWERARSRAALWSAEGSLARLEELHRLPADPPSPALEARRRRWTRFLALMGPSTERVEQQTQALVGTLERLGLEAAVLHPTHPWRDVWQALGRVDVVLLTTASFGAPETEHESRSHGLLRLHPRPRRTYLLDDATVESVPPRLGTPIFGACRLGAELSEDALCKTIAQDAWEVLSRPTRLESAARGLRSALSALRAR